MKELHDQIRAAPSTIGQFHASDLRRIIGQTGYDARVSDVIRQFSAVGLQLHSRSMAEPC